MAQVNGRIPHATVLAVLMALLPFAGFTAGESLFVAYVTEPTISPAVVTQGEVATVSFDVSISTLPPCDVAETALELPACVYALAWRISLDGEWLSDEATNLREGYRPISVLKEENLDVHVDERVFMAAAPGEHSVHVMANWVLGVPVEEHHQDIFARWYPCGTDSGPPEMRCDYTATGWKIAPTAFVDVEPRPLLRQFQT